MQVTHQRPDRARRKPQESPQTAAELADDAEDSEPTAPAYGRRPSLPGPVGFVFRCWAVPEPAERDAGLCLWPLGCSSRKAPGRPYCAAHQHVAMPPRTAAPAASTTPVKGAAK